MEQNVQAGQLRQMPTHELWASIAPDAAIKVWMSDLSRLMTPPYRPDFWSIVGQGVVIEADEEADVRDLIHHVAGELGMGLHILDGNSAIENFPQWFESLVEGDPAMVFIGAGPWQGEKFADKHPSAPYCQYDEEHCRKFRADLILLMSEKFPGVPVVLVTVISSLDQMDVALRNAGLFDRRIQMPKIPDEGLASAFVEGIGRDKCGPTILDQASKVGRLLRHEYPDRRRRKLMQKAMERLAWRDGRLLEFDDMVRFASFGTSDMDALVHDDNLRRRNAVHEAGHAVVSHLTSRHQIAPEYCSIVPRDDSYGIVVSAFDSHERNSDDPSWKDMTYKLRVMLSGRAAEHLLLGPEEVSARGASSDLEKATELANSMFGLWGLSGDNSSDDFAGSNLAVILGEASGSEAARLESTVREFLKKTFLEALSVLRDNRTYLDKLVDTLIDRQYLLQEDLLTLYADLQTFKE